MRRVITILGCVLLVATACTRQEPEDAAPVTTTTALGTGEVANGKLAGMQGTAPRAEPREDFISRLEEQAPGLPDPTYAAEAYDAVMISALATEVARSDAPGRFAGRIVEVTRQGQKCVTWRQCKDLTDAGSDIDYDGVSGPIEMLPSGEPGEATFAVLQFGDDDQLDQTGSRTAVATAPQVPLPTLDFRAGPPADGTLRIGLLVGQPDADVVRAEAQRAGARIALEEINRVDGVLGRPVEMTDTDDDTPTADSIDQLLGDDVDVIIGPSTTDQLPEVIPPVTDAGVVLFSASAAADPLTAATGGGRFFRLAPDRSIQAQVLADVAAGDGALELLILAQSGQYGSSLATEFRTEFEKLGGSIVASIPFDPASVDPAVINAALATSSDGVVIFGDPEPVGALITSLATDGRGPEQTPYYTADITSVLTRYVN